MDGLYHYVFGYKKIKEELSEGRKAAVPAWFGALAKYLYVPLTIAVFILGIAYKGIG